MAPSPFTKPPGPVALIVLDGVGLAPPSPYNAWAVAATPTLDALSAGELPAAVPAAAGAAIVSTALAASGRAVGLRGPDDAGNSEVGHVTLGAGRVLRQGAAAVDEGLAGGRFREGDVWRWLMEAVGRRQRGDGGRDGDGGSSPAVDAGAAKPDDHGGTAGGADEEEGQRPPATLHLLGLLSDGCVHSVMDHVWTLLDAAVADGVRRIRMHVLTDGRDVGERTALGYLDQLDTKLAALRDGADGGVDVAVASGGGRMVVTMDRYGTDWGVVAAGWHAHVAGDTEAVATFPSAAAAVEAAYKDGLTDQHIPPFVVVGPDGRPVGRMADGDAVVLWNYRGDRAVEMARALDTPRDGEWPHFDRRHVPRLRFAGMTCYDEEAGVPAAALIPPVVVDHPVGEIVAAAGLTRLCVAEAKKYGHLCYFFNGHRGIPFDPSVERYVKVDSLPGRDEDHPAMATEAVVARVLDAVHDRDGPVPDLLCVNFANGDMCGHTGVMAAAVAGMEAVDAAVARLLSAVVGAGGVAVVTADHGNVEQMAQLDGGGGVVAGDTPGGWAPLTAHTTAAVPLWVVGAPVRGMAIDEGARWDAGTPGGDPTCEGPGIVNVSAAVLHLLGLEAPAEYLPSVLMAKKEA